MLLKSTFLPQTSSGWWFQTCFIFPDVGNVIIPTDELIFFQRGRAQPPTSSCFAQQPEARVFLRRI